MVFCYWHAFETGNGAKNLYPTGLGMETPKKPEKKSFQVEEKGRKNQKGFFFLDG